MKCKDPSAFPPGDFFANFAAAHFAFFRKYYGWVLHGKRQGEKIR